MQEYSNDDFHILMEKVFKKYGNKNAVVSHDRENKPTAVTYSQIYVSIEPAKNFFIKMGLNPGNRIAMITKPGGNAAVTCLILAMLGYTNVLLDASLPAKEINRLLKNSDVSAIITSLSFYNEIDEEIKSSILTLALSDEAGKYEIINEPSPEMRHIPVIPENKDVIAIIYSSGTTGTMKGVEITYRSMIYSAECAKIYATYNSKTKFLHVLPLNHIAGYTMLYITYLCGAEMGFMYEINAYYLAKGLTVYNPTHLTMIPKVFEAIRDKVYAELDKKPKFIRNLMKNVINFCGFVRRKTGIKLRFLTKPIRNAALGKNMLTCGSGTMPCREDIMRFYLNIGINFLDVYGATETGFPITATNCTKSKYPVSGAGNVDQFPFTKVKISKENGEICVKSPMLMNGYFCDPEETAKAYDSEGYFKTGDCGIIDKDNILHITGRLKESIILRSGKKVSAVDVDHYYSKECKDIKLAVCGVSDEKNHYDRIVLFIETSGQETEKIEEAENKIKEISAVTSGSYKIAEIRRIDKIPYTTIGKVKRYLLKEEAMKSYIPEEKTNTEKKNDKSSRGYVYEILAKIISKNICVEDNMSLKEDMGLDSLDMLDLCSNIETQYEMSLAEHLPEIKTVNDLIDYIENNRGNNKDVIITENINKYPVPLSCKDKKKLNKIMKFIRRTYNLKISGTENLIKGKSYIFCPNHESHLDGLFCLTALNEKLGETSLNCLAKQEHLDNKISRKGLILMGGIPVDRSGNPAPAMKRALEVINEDKNFLIHPEGTRTRDGKLGKFKFGAAKLAQDSGHSIVPVCINGAFEIYPPNKKLPKIFDFRHFKKYTLDIRFAEPISPEGKSIENMTEILRQSIVNMKEGN